jgi:hypothetical protein
VQRIEPVVEHLAQLAALVRVARVHAVQTVEHHAEEVERRGADEASRLLPAGLVVHALHDEPEEQPVHYVIYKRDQVGRAIRRNEVEHRPADGVADVEPLLVARQHERIDALGNAADLGGRVHLAAVQIVHRRRNEATPRAEALCNFCNLRSHLLVVCVHEQLVCSLRSTRLCRWEENLVRSLYSECAIVNDGVIGQKGVCKRSGGAP